MAPNVTAEVKTHPAANEWNKEIWSGFRTVRFRQPGFLYRDIRNKWNRVIRNLFELPVLNIRIRHAPVAPQNEIDTGVNQADVSGYHPVVYGRDSRTLGLGSLLTGERASRRLLPEPVPADGMPRGIVPLRESCPHP